MTREHTFRLLTWTPWLVVPALALRAAMMRSHLPAKLTFKTGWVATPLRYAVGCIVAAVLLAALATWVGHMQKARDIRTWMVVIAYNGFMVLMFLQFDRNLRENAYGVSTSPWPVIVCAAALLAFILGVAWGAPRPSSPAERRHKELL